MQKNNDRISRDCTMVGPIKASKQHRLTLEYTKKRRKKRKGNVPGVRKRQKEDQAHTALQR